MRIILLLYLVLYCPFTWAAQNLETPAAFVQQAFDGAAPSAKTVWLIDTLGQKAETILGHPPNQLRERYWRNGKRSVWVLEEVGKERVITTGWIVEAHKIVDAKVLIYRESRGWEIRYPFFTQQFQGASLNDKKQLSNTIDGISGATLSVRAMRRMAKLALLLDGYVMAQHGTN